MNNVTLDTYFDKDVYKHCALWQMLYNCTWEQAQMAVIGKVIFE